MVDSQSPDDEFKDALNAVLTDAVEDGVTIEGGWKITTAHNTHWDVQITAVEYTED
ncbi:hypothetical protein U3A55_00870 [Salarchaeum sp. III]|uniref:hypothetical protein n=1 Tax=Salarchaeum sp. III TaxID=3107927 RepID=UPI002EDA0029